MRIAREVVSGDMDVLVTYQCKMGCDMWDKWIGSHRRWLLHARRCISCNGDALCPPHTLFKHGSCETRYHSPQGVETGDLRSSRHMPQVSSDMPLVSVPLLHCQSVVGRVLVYACEALGSVLGWIAIETRRDGHV